MPPDELPLIERDHELATLTEALAQSPAVAVIEGEPGIGKTRLVREALASERLSGRRLLTGHAHPVRDPYPIGPIVEALATATLPPAQRLSPLSGALRAVLPERADALPPAPPPLDDPLQTRHRLLRAAAELLRALESSILVLEDLHWADEATIELLDMLGDEPPTGLSVAITYRACDLTPRARLSTVLGYSLRPLVAARIGLEPLSRPGVARMAAGVLGASGTTISSEAAQVLHERSGGVPFVVEEDTRLLRERGMLRRRDHEWTYTADLTPRRDADRTHRDARDAPHDVPADAAVSPAVHAIISHRAATLSGDARAVLEAAAVLARPADVELLAAVARLSVEGTAVATAEATRAGLLREQHTPHGATTALRHALAGHAIYQATPGPQRRRLHAAAASALAASDNPGLTGRIADHHRHAGHTVAWARSAEAAAELAAGHGELAAAYTYLRDILRADVVPLDRHGHVAITLGWTARGCPEQTAATASLLTSALVCPALSTTERGELRLLRGWSQLDNVEADSQAAATDITTAIADLSGRPDLQAMALAALAIPARLPDLDLAAHVAYLDRARAALDRTPDPVAHACVLTTALHVSITTGSPGAWDALAALPKPGDSVQVNQHLIRGMLNTADAALALGHYGRSRDLVEEALALASTLDLHAYDNNLRVTWLRARWITGDISAEPPATGLTESPHAHIRLHSRLLSGQVLASKGRLEAARATLRETAEQARRIGELSVASYALAELHRTALTAPDRRAAHLLSSQLLDALAGKQIWTWAAPLLPFLPLDLAADVLARYRTGVADRDAPLAHASLTLTEARVAEASGNLSPALRGYAAARHQYTALPDPRLASHTALLEARCQIAAGHQVDADMLHRAWQAFARLNAPWDADRVKHLIRQAGLPAPHRRGRPGYGNRLSPREREVAGLAAAGHINREIAARLFLSERTIKYHLTNAMRKLGINSRRKLRDVLSGAVQTATN